MYGLHYMKDIISFENKKYITVIYDKGRDNNMTLKSKLVSAYRKTNTGMSNLNKDMQYLKKHKSVRINY